MKITTFNPLIITQDAEPVIELFEALGFERHHTKKDIGDDKVVDVRMKNPNGFYVDVAQGDGEYSMIRMNVDNFDEAIEFLKAHGFREPRHEQAKKTTNTGSSQFTVMVSPTGYIMAISEHFRNRD
jgi:hypothetical protein